VRSKQGPAGEPGRPFPDLQHPAVAYGMGYGGAIFLNMLMARSIIPWLGLDWQRGLVSAPYFCLSACVPWALCEWFPVIRRKWDSAVESGVWGPVPGPWMLGTGIVCGSAAGLVVLSALSLPDNVLRWSILLTASLVGPLPGVWWILRRKPRAPEEDYDDRMRRRELATGDQINLPDLAATEAFGRRLGALLFPNAVVALIGPLGAGKTHLTRAVAEGIGIANPAVVTSPTFTLVHEYPARLLIYHFDAYRLNGPNEFLDLGVNEYYEAGGVCLIEWADKVESALPAERLTIRLTPVDENRRTVEVVGVGEKYEALVTALASRAA
jgi:tRNA threonylcarbamoyladenosine biosynthesis protein TsaE